MRWGILNFFIVGKGENIVFLHGWGGSTTSFEFVANSLNNRSILLDFYGFGMSPEPSIPIGVPEYAKAVLDILKLLKIKKAIFVGHSFGGRVAIEIASKFPNFVSKLVLIDSAGLKPRRKLSYYLKIAIHKILKKLGKKGLKGSLDYAILSATMKQTFKNVVSYDQTSQLNSIKCPTAIFWGKDDKETPKYMARKLHRKIADSALFYLNGGHFSYVDDYKVFLPIFKSFIK